MTSVLTVDFYSDTLSEYMDVRVIMPTLENGKNARVLYLLHGLSDAPSVWLHRTNLERYAEAVGNLCVVLVSGHRSWYANTASGLAYRTFVFEEIPRKIENMFRVSTRREDTFVAGNSMGGYGAAKFALLYPEKFVRRSLFRARFMRKNILRMKPKDARFSAMKRNGKTMFSALFRKRKTPPIIPNSNLSAARTISALRITANFSL